MSCCRAALLALLCTEGALSRVVRVVRVVRLVRLVSCGARPGKMSQVKLRLQSP